jgi:hypothetical protein
MVNTDDVEHDMAIHRDALRQLLDRWEKGAVGGWDVPAERHATAQMVIPWTIQVHRFAEAFLLVEDRYEHEGHVLARSALEYAIVGHWASQVGNNAVMARYGEDQRRLRALVKDLKGSRSDVVPAQWKGEMFADHIDAEPPEEVDEQKLIGDFEQICHEVGVHNTLYPSYRMLCWITHPTLHAASVYHVEKQGLAMTPQYREQRPIGLVGLVGYCVFWSARTVDDLSVNHPNREWLDALATTIEVRPRLPLPRAHRQAEP